MDYKASQRRDDPIFRYDSDVRDALPVMKRKLPDTLKEAASTVALTTRVNEAIVSSGAFSVIGHKLAAAAMALAVVAGIVWVSDFERVKMTFDAAFIAGDELSASAAMSSGPAIEAAKGALERLAIGFYEAVNGLLLKL